MAPYLEKRGANTMKQYLKLLKHIRENGEEKSDRTGTGTLSVFGYQMRFDLQRFPLVTTKKVHLKSIIHELLWFLRGEENIKYLTDHGVSIWNEWADENGSLGPVYGKQWRSWATPRFVGRYACGDIIPDHKEIWSRDTIDQIAQVVHSLKHRPHSRRHIVTAWNPADMPDESVSPQENVKQGKMALATCHCLFQFYVDADNRLSCQMYQRSADVFLGVPFNIASYALLTMMIGQVCGMLAGEFIHTLGDAHIYLNHLDQVDEQLKRKPRVLPVMEINPAVTDIDQFKYEDFKLHFYDPHPAIKAPIAK